MSDAPKREPYIAILVYETVIAGTTPTYREDVVLIWATSEQDAEDRARTRGAAEESDYQNAHGEDVSMRLKHVIDISPAIDTDLTQDADLYARHFDDFAAYEHFETLLSE